MPGAWQPLLWKSQRQAGFKPHELTGQENAHSKARRQAEIYTSKTRMAPPKSLQVCREGDKNQKIAKSPENNLCWNGSLTRSTLLLWGPALDSQGLWQQFSARICAETPWKVQRKLCAKSPAETSCRKVLWKVENLWIRCCRSMRQLDGKLDEGLSDAPCVSVRTRMIPRKVAESSPWVLSEHWVGGVVPIWNSFSCHGGSACKPPSSNPLL